MLGVRRREEGDGEDVMLGNPDFLIDDPCKHPFEHEHRMCLIASFSIVCVNGNDNT